jgi:hypothetical protein
MQGNDSSTSLLCHIKNLQLGMQGFECIILGVASDRELNGHVVTCTEKAISVDVTPTPGGCGTWRMCLSFAGNRAFRVVGVLDTVSCEKTARKRIIV